MDQALINAYQTMTQKTYDTVDKTVFKVIHQNLSGKLTVRDLNVLYTIFQREKLGFNISKEIAKALRLSKTNLSNRLDRLSQLGLIQKRVNDVDHREYFIDLTELGIKALAIYLNLIDETIRRLNKTFKATEKIKLLRALQKIASVGESQKLPVSWLSPAKIPKQTQVIINTIYQRVFDHDQDFLASHQFEGSLKTFRIYLEIYIQSSQGRCTLNQLHESLFIPLSSLSRIVEQSPIITKKTDRKDKRIKYLSVKKSFESTLEDFMTNRLDFYHDTIKLVSQSSFDLMERVLKILNDYANEV
jgi:DNA-binding MarR family transcriptional regulator